MKMIESELAKTVKSLYNKRDSFHESKINTYGLYSEKWSWWTHPKNLEFVLSIIGAIADDRIYYRRIPRYLNTTFKWFNYLKSNPSYQGKFSEKSNYQLFDYLCNVEPSTFILLYNEFNQNMGNPNAKSREEWISQHFSYLPKTTHGFNKDEVILDYNWRLSHQGNLSKYWGSVRPDQKTNILNCFFSNRQDAGKSNKYEVIMKKEVLLDLLDILPPLYQIISLFIAYTGLRLSDALKCLIIRWGDLQYISYQGFGRFYIPNVVTQKRNKPIYFIFIAEELINLLNYYIPNNSENKIILLLKKSKSFFEDEKDQIYYLKKHFIKELKKALEDVRYKHPDIKSYQTIKTHLLRKYFITRTNVQISLLRNELDSPEDYLRYIAGHQTLNPHFFTYDQSLSIPQINLKRFVNYIEPSVAVGFAQKKIKELAQRKKEIESLFQLHFGQYIKERNKKDYFSCVDILTFFNKYQLNISWEELSIFMTNAVQQGIIQTFGSYFSFHDEETINDLEKYKINCFIQNFPETEREGIKFYELCKIIHNNNMVASEKEFLSILKKLKELKILFEVNNRFKISKLAKISC